MMKKLLLAACLFASSAFSATPTRFTNITVSSTATIGSTIAASTSSLLNLESTTLGFLPPRLTTTQRNAISSPTAGLQIFNTTTGTIQYYTGTAWGDVATASNVSTVSTTTNATFYPLFVGALANSVQTPNLGSGLTFNPSTNALTTTTFIGALTGNASTATTATNATNGATVSTSSNATFYPAFFAATANSNQPFNLGTGLKFNPSTSTLTTTTFVGALTGAASLNLLASSNLSDVASTVTSLNNILPSQTGKANDVLTSDGTNVSWVAPAGGGITSTIWTSDSASLTPASNAFGTISSAHFFKKRMGDTLYIRGDFTSGTTAAHTAAMAIGNSLAIDSAKISSSASAAMVGRGYRLGASDGALSTDTILLEIFYDGADTGNVYIAAHEGSTAGTFNKINANSLGASGNVFTFEIDVPISGWTQTN